MWYKSVPTTMQGFGDYCKNMVQDNGSNGSSISITLRDTRDNNTYTVAKLKDGRCWMTQNLKLQNYTLKPEDSDVLAEFKLPPNLSIASSTAYNDSAYVYVHSDQSLKYGAHYSWFAATAGSGKSGGSQAGNPNFNAPNSICPKGWRLPTKTDTELLVPNYTYQTIQQPPMNLVNSGQTQGYKNQLLNWCQNCNTREDNGRIQIFGRYWIATGGCRSGDLPCTFQIWNYSDNSSPTFHAAAATNGPYMGYAIRCLSKQ